MCVLETRVLTDDEIRPDVLAQIRGLVFAAYDGDFSEEDWEHTRGGWRVVVFDGRAPVSHAAVVARVLQVAQWTLQAGYVEGVATTAGRRRQGLGGLVMARATSLVQSKFEIGALSTSSHSFYQRFGWERWRGHSFVRDGVALLRTADEDDGLMVLRCGPSAGIDLAAPIACECRAGDDW
ncbi:MAG: GNAT family N-acetyltransferase [Chloroflexota bacterium]|nr:GNAT family N-acetyltransferase [Chloroflexota bacterium]